MTDDLNPVEITRLRAELARERAHRGCVGEAAPLTSMAGDRGRCCARPERGLRGMGVLHRLLRDR